MHSFFFPVVYKDSEPNSTFKKAITSSSNIDFICTINILNPKMMFLVHMLMKRISKFVSWYTTSSRKWKIWKSGCSGMVYFVFRWLADCITFLDSLCIRAHMPTVLPETTNKPWRVLLNHLHWTERYTFWTKWWTDYTKRVRSARNASHEILLTF